MRGAEVPIDDFPRYDNPFAQVSYGSPDTVIEQDGYRVALDFKAGTRDERKITTDVHSIRTTHAIRSQRH